MNTERIKIDLSNLIKVVFQNQGFDSDLIEDLDFIEDLGMDSMTFISMVIEIEQYFDIEVPDDCLLMEKFSNITQIITIIEAELSKKDAVED